jgi:hypothetical protein
MLVAKLTTPFYTGADLQLALANFKLENCHLAIHIERKTHGWAVGKR